MERREAVFALEDELICCVQLAKRARYLMKDLLDDFFIYGDSPMLSAPVTIPREDYGSAAAKAEIVGDLLNRQFDLLEKLLCE